MKIVFTAHLCTTYIFFNFYLSKCVCNVIYKFLFEVFANDVNVIVQSFEDLRAVVTRVENNNVIRGLSSFCDFFLYIYFFSIFRNS